MNSKPSFRYDPSPEVERLFEEENSGYDVPPELIVLCRWLARRHKAVQPVLVPAVFIIGLAILTVYDFTEDGEWW